MARIIGDDGKAGYYTGPDPETNKGYLLYRVISKVLAYQWDPDAVNPQTGKKGIRIYNLAKNHPHIFNMVFKNGNPGNEMESGWRFNPVVLANVIDRSDMEWHQKNKKLKVLSKKVSETSSGALWYERGFPDALYTTIMEDIVAAFGDWEGYDIVIRKVKGSPWYKAFHAINDAARFSDDTDVTSLIKQGALTAEERSWEGWDFDVLYNVTPYLKVQKNLGDSLRRIDKELKVCFYDELAELVEAEEAKKTAEKDRAEGTSVATGVKNDAKEEPPSSEEGRDTPEAAPASVETGARVRQPQNTEAKNSGFDVEAVLKDTERYKGASLLTEQEKAWITGVDANGLFTWDPDAGDLLSDAENKEQLIPEYVHCNPYTGRIYPEVSVA
jgi:hypothetical protein